MVCGSVAQGGFRETKMRNGGRVFLAVRNLCVRMKILVAMFDTNHSVTPDSCTWNLLPAKMAWCAPFWFFGLIMIVICYLLKCRQNAQESNSTFQRLVILFYFFTHDVRKR